MGFSSMNTGVGCHALLQGIVLTQGSNLHLLRLLHWVASSLSLALSSDIYSIEVFAVFKTVWVSVTLGAHVSGPRELMISLGRSDRNRRSSFHITQYDLAPSKWFRWCAGRRRQNDLWEMPPDELPETPNQMCVPYSGLKINIPRASLVTQWWRICLLLQETQVGSLIW